MILCIVLVTSISTLYVVDAQAHVFLPNVFSNMGFPSSSMLSESSNGTYVLSDDQDINYNTRLAETLYDHHIDLDEKIGVKLSWRFDKRNITFKLSAPTYVGWVGIGMSMDGTTWAGSDFIMLCRTGAAFQDFYVVDAYIDDKLNFVRDESQDVHKEFAFVTSTVVGVFTRPLVTCDQEDVEITKDTLRILWAYGRKILDKTMTLHPQIRLEGKGEMNLKLLNPSTAEFGHTKLPPDSNMTSIVVKANDVNVLQSKNRQCVAFRFATIKEKIHITEFEPQIQKDRKFNIRQIVIRECHDIFTGLDQSSTKPVDCDVDVKQAKCTTTILAWVPSMVTFAFPGHIGYPVNSSGSHFMMEIRYRTSSDQGFRDSSGMKIHYTTKLRPLDIGVLTTGSLVHKSQLIPPRTPNFRLQGHCMAECIQMSISEDKPVQIFAATLHSRETGRKIRVRHFRDGSELAPVTADNAFRYEDYQTEFIPTNIQLQKGDNMIVECNYNTTDRGEITFVNNSVGGESCLAYLSYYPRNVKLTACETAPTESVIMSTVGAARPEEMLKQAQTFAWTKEQTRVYNKRLLENQVYVHCGDIEFENPKPVPKIGRVYKEEHKCYSPPSTEDTAASVDISTYSTNTEFSTSGTAQQHSSVMVASLMCYLHILLWRLLLT